jgi:glycolate oxidase FAD binding subunit
MSTTAASPALLRDLTSICGRDHVLDNALTLRRYAIDDLVPRVAVSPGTPAEVAAVLKFAHDHNVVVVPAGGFTHQFTGAIPEAVDILLRTNRLTAVEHYDPGDLTIGIGAGATLAAVESITGPNRQLLPLEAPLPETCTIGGALASATHGPLKHAYGGVRDYCTGIRYVTVDGKLAKAGARVVKNVAGYDMMKLLIGSFGTLAVVVGASFKVFPAPRQTRTFIASFAGLREVVRFRDQLLSSPLSPMCLELVSPHAHRLLAGDSDDDSWRVLVRAAGSDAVLARYGSELATPSAAAAREISGDTESQLWRHIANWPHAVFESAHNAALLRLDLPLQAAELALAAAESAATDNDFLCAAVGRIGVGSLLVALVPITPDPPAAMQYANAVSALRAALPRDASAIVLRCPVEAKRHFSVWGSSPNDLEAMRAIHEAFDQRHILNRGRFLF